jgi:hypothetical protein
MAHGLLKAALGCALLAWYLVATRSGGARDESARAQLRRERTATHTMALRAVSARLGGLEALPPELLARTLAEVATIYPAFVRLVVCDANGRVLAAVPARDTALVGVADPSEARRTALASTSAGEGFARERPGGVLELGVRHAAGYVGGDLPVAAVTPRLEGTSTSARVIASWALAAIAVLFSVTGWVISSKRRP